MSIDQEVRLFKPATFSDSRGMFQVTYEQDQFDAWVGRAVHFTQDNHSVSVKNVLRGLHYQRAPEVQGKLVRVSRGVIYDVAVDVRRSSPTFGEWVGYTLTELGEQLWIPEGFAHGFVTLSERADVLYKTTARYAPDLERTVRWDDSRLGIEWPLDRPPILSERDAAAPTLADAEVLE